ncbi:Crp/Fnr family transcriptional regulator [Accumulibacter sp.]|uniref:Crp/Fnr family transcriptional regulator n=1 Tax=Accumulibacter sp. TaxID=2053492 RepID=UPI0025FEBF9C|nr:Crp/Fnr family transcriptional regulator [Accumulibacter sp.]MCM8625378.1 Crp/Fnr family transcriptional regulator [Accumulibacter sp.]
MHRPENPIDTGGLLVNVPLFNGLDHREVARIAAGTQPVAVARGEVIYREGETPTGLHLIVYGQVKLALHSLQGSEKVLEILEAGETFGEAELFLDDHYTLTAQALKESLLLHISRATLLDELDRDPLLVRKMITGLCQRVHQVISDVEACSLYSGCRRVVDYLLRSQPDGSRALTVTLPATKYVIASRLSLTQEAFSRILNELSVRGLIAVEARRIHIPDVARLRAYAA